MVIPWVVVPLSSLISLVLVALPQAVVGSSFLLEFIQLVVNLDYMFNQRDHIFQLTFHSCEFHVDVALQATAIVADQRASVLTCLVSVFLEFRGVGESATNLSQSIQVVFHGLDVVNVAKHVADFLLKSSLGAKHGLSGSHDSISAFMLEIVLKEGLDPVKGFPP